MNQHTDLPDHPHYPLHALQRASFELFSSGFRTEGFEEGADELVARLYTPKHDGIVHVSHGDPYAWINVEGVERFGPERGTVVTYLTLGAGSDALLAAYRNGQKRRILFEDLADGPREHLTLAMIIGLSRKAFLH